MFVIGKNPRMHFCEKKSEREIARLASRSRNTIRSSLRAPSSALSDPISTSQAYSGCVESMSCRMLGRYSARHL